MNDLIKMNKIKSRKLLLNLRYFIDDNDRIIGSNYHMTMRKTQLQRHIMKEKTPTTNISIQIQQPIKRGSINEFSELKTIQELPWDRDCLARPKWPRVRSAKFKLRTKP